MVLFRCVYGGYLPVKLTGDSDTGEVGILDFAIFRQGAMDAGMMQSEGELACMKDLKKYDGNNVSRGVRGVSVRRLRYIFFDDEERFFESVYPPNYRLVKKFNKECKSGDTSLLEVIRYIDTVLRVIEKDPGSALKKMKENGERVVPHRIKNNSDGTVREESRLAKETYRWQCLIDYKALSCSQLL